MDFEYSEIENQSKKAVAVKSTWVRGENAQQIKSPVMFGKRENSNFFGKREKRDFMLVYVADLSQGRIMDIIPSW